MNREEMKKYANGYVKQGMKIVIDELIDTIADDRESQVCEDCEYKGCVYMMTAYESEGYTAEEFGCNKFERKNNDR